MPCFICGYGRELKVQVHCYFDKRKGIPYVLKSFNVPHLSPERCKMSQNYTDYLSLIVVTDCFYWQLSNLQLLVCITE